MKLVIVRLVYITLVIFICNCSYYKTELRKLDKSLKSGNIKKEEYKKKKSSLLHEEQLTDMINLF